MDNQIFADSPPPPPAANLFIPKKGITYHATMLGPWRGVWIHWMGKRSLPCLGDDCPKPRHRRPAVWRGYFPAAVWKRKGENVNVDQWQAVVMSLSPEQATELSEYNNLAGLVGLEISRGTTNNEVTIIARELKTKPENLPSPPSVELTLYRVWGIRPPAATT